MPRKKEEKQKKHPKKRPTDERIVHGLNEEAFEEFKKELYKHKLGVHGSREKNVDKIRYTGGDISAMTPLGTVEHHSGLEIYDVSVDFADIGDIDVKKDIIRTAEKYKKRYSGK